MQTYSVVHDSIDDNYIAHNVHRILARSYTVYFLFFLCGILLDLFFKIEIFSNPDFSVFGFVFFFLASILILWAQNTSRNIPRENITKDTFCRGPYCYTRSPTHWGLFILMFSFGIITNSLFVTLFTVFAFIITRLVHLKKEELMLKVRYGAPYEEYQKSVRL